ncbi:MAG: lipid-A-disaccharide synthase [Thermoanaerobaculia bacterium]
MNVLISSGESSGDRLGAALMREMRQRRADLSFLGMGGPRMRAAGLETAVESEAISVMGVFEVIGKLPRIWTSHRRLLRAAEEKNPGLAVLVDFPDFHFRLGKALARRGIPVVYYVSPQVWAWRRGRVRVMRSFVRRMITLFPFETDIYREAGIDAVCAGHPLADEVEMELAGSGQIPRDPARRRLVLMPGSRPAEVRRHWPVLRDAVRLLSGTTPIEAFVVPAPGLDHGLFPGAQAEGISFFSGNVDGLLASCDVLLVASGTSTLQGALCGAPMVVVYRTSPATFALARRLVRVSHVAMANIVAGERIAPELLQDEATPERIAGEASRLLRDPAASERMREAWRTVWDRLGPRNAAAHAAEAVLEVLPA